jgi:hypothetical protein
MQQLSLNGTATFSNYSVTHSLPSSLWISNCSVPAAQFEVHFLGGLIGKTLDETLAPRIEQALEEHAEQLLCGALAPAVSEGVTQWMQQSNVKRVASIDAGRAVYPPPVINGTYDWRTSQLASLHALLDTLTLHSEAGGGAHMTSCLLNSSVLDALRPPPTQEDNNLLVNRLLDLLTNGTGEVHVPVSVEVPVPLPLGNSSTLEVTAVSLSGLDSFSNFSLLDPSAASGAVLSSDIGLQTLTLQLFLRFNATAYSTYEDPYVYSEELIVTLGLSHVMLELDLVVALSDTELGDLFVDQYLNYSNCVMLALQELSVSSLGLLVTVDEVSLTQTGGDATSLEEDVVLFLDNTLEWLLSSWPVTDLIAGLAQTSLKEGINDQLEATRSSLQHEAESNCPQHIEASGVEYLEWNTSEKLARLNAVLNEALGADGVNNLMSCVTGGTGRLTLSKNDSNASLTLSGLDSFYDFALLYPLPGLPYDLGSRIALGQCDGSSVCNPFGLTLQFQIGEKQVYLDMEMQNVELFLDLLFMIDKSSVLNLNLMQAQTQGCVMTATEQLLVQAASLHLTDAELYLDDGGEGEPINITHAVEEILARFQEVGGLVDRLDSLLAEVTGTAASRCDGTYDPSADDDTSADKADGTPQDWTWQIALLLVGCFFSLVFLAYLYQHFGVMTEEEEAYRDSVDILKHEKGSSLQEHLFSPSESDSRCSSTDFDEQEESNPTLTFATAILTRLGYGHVKYDAIFSSPHVPLSIRVLFPIAVMGCIATTVYANIVVGTSVMVELDLGDKKIEPPSVFDFGLGNTVRDM